MRKLLWLTVLLAAGLFSVGCNSVNSPSHGSQHPESSGSSENSGEIEDSSSDSGSENFGVCNIVYRCWDETAQSVKQIPAFMWRSAGVYPTEYQENTKTKIDGLRHFRKDNDTVYAFAGWYYDADCTNALTDSTVSDSVRGDITLYAKIVERAKENGDVVTATLSYQWNDYGDVKDGIEYFPEAMTDGVEIPTEYVEGEKTTLPKLNMWKKNSKIVYEFEGWYYDKALKNKVSGGELPATQTGNVTLYAKIVAYVN
ncbi:MAG: InlB B-repeat-containing protein [Clostridia bacterium]|nr:InlB B-repeat-containing protein [Clostridia bacterium]